MGVKYFCHIFDRSKTSGVVKSGERNQEVFFGPHLLGQLSFKLFVSNSVETTYFLRVYRFREHVGNDTGIYCNCKNHPLLNFLQENMTQYPIFNHVKPNIFFFFNYEWLTYTQCKLSRLHN